MVRTIDINVSDKKCGDYRFYGKCLVLTCGFAERTLRLTDMVELYLLNWSLKKLTDHF